MNDSPILNCSPKAPVGKAFQKWLLIPVYAWKVIVVSSKKQEELDVFQKVIFNLMRSGDYEVDQLSGFSHLDPDLVRILLEHLHADGMRTSHAQVVRYRIRYLTAEFVTVRRSM